MHSHRPRAFDGPLMLAALLLLLLAAGVWLIPEEHYLGRLATVLWGAIPSVWALAYLAFHRSERFRLWCTRWWYKLSSREVSWRLTAEYQLHNESGSFKQAVNSISEHLADGDRFVQEDDHAVVLTIHALPVHVTQVTSSDWDGDSQQVRVEWLELPRSVRNWPRVLNRQVTPALSQLESDLDPKQAKYIAQARFGNANPYFGLFIHNVPHVRVKRFNIELHDHIGTSTVTIKVTDTRIELVSFDLHALREVALRYMSLGTLAGGEV